MWKNWISVFQTYVILIKSYRYDIYRGGLEITFEQLWILTNYSLIKISNEEI